MQFLLEHIDKLITVAALLSSIIGGAYLLREEVKKLGKRMTVVERKMDDVTALGTQLSFQGTRIQSIESQQKAMGDVLVVLARQDERMNSMDKRTDERFQNMRRELDLLRQGEGFVLPIHRGAFEHGDK